LFEAEGFAKIVLAISFLRLEHAYGCKELAPNGKTMSPSSRLSKADLARADERLRHSHPVNHFGFRLVKAERGRAVFRMAVQDHHKQIHRVVHGGVVAMLADTAGGFASFLAAPKGSRVATIELKINFLEPVGKGQIEADARVLRLGRTTSVVDCDIRDEGHRLVAKGLMTFSVRLPEPHKRAHRSRRQPK
jgi:uncharacterized protein (TIGR00369 family)